MQDVGRTERKRWPRVGPENLQRKKEKCEETGGKRGERRDRDSAREKKE